MLKKNTTAMILVWAAYYWYYLAWGPGSIDNFQNLCDVFRTVMDDSFSSE